MKEVSWQTIFSGKLNVMLGDGREYETFFTKDTQLCIFVMQAIRVLRNKFLTGAEVSKNWRIKSFSPEERILKIEETRA